MNHSDKENKQTLVNKKVTRIKWKDHQKKLFFSEGTFIDVPLSACVSKGDEVITTNEGAWVLCKNGVAQILPSYIARESFTIGSLNLEFLIKEITELDELEAYKALTQFHYRGHNLFGRTSRLIVRSFHPIYPKVIGYIELTTPFFMNKARAQILDAPFKDKTISWDAWDLSTWTQYINLIVRIARCVIYPEFRGLGLGKVLIKHAAEFARARWQVSCLKPFFLEISADMLKFVPFAQKAGMVFVGETEGNLKRVSKDLDYLLQNQERISNEDIVKKEVCGIIDQQRSRMRKAALLMEREGWTLEMLLTRLERLNEKSVLKDFDLFHDIVNLPKPTYLQGLTTEAVAFVQTRAELLAPKNGHTPRPLMVKPLSAPIVLDNLSLTYESRVRRTWQTHSIQQAFGISPREITHDVIKNLSLTIKPGEIILLTGTSGSGKTTLLSLFQKKRNKNYTGNIQWPNNYHPSIFRPIKSAKALIEIIGKGDVQTALHRMGLVGLSDAYIYLKRFDELSNGQQYRAMLAQLIIGEHNVWLADEFCANLDSLTANLVADRLQRLARKLGAVVIVASSQPEAFVSALRPDKVIRLTSAWEHSISTGPEFISHLPVRRITYPIPSLTISPEYLRAIRLGLKRSTIRKGRKSIRKGLLLLTARGTTELVSVTEVKCISISSLTDDYARKDGFKDLNELRAALQRHYPDLRDRSLVTVISFDYNRPSV
jgi:uncharacterized protein